MNRTVYAEVENERPPDFGHRVGSLGRLVDGVDNLRRVCREEIKAGAQFIKVMADGGDP